VARDWVDRVFDIVCVSFRVHSWDYLTFDHVRFFLQEGTNVGVIILAILAELALSAHATILAHAAVLAVAAIHTTAPL
jgi:hypothetical protein